MRDSVDCTALVHGLTDDQGRNAQGVAWRHRPLERPDGIPTPLRLGKYSPQQPIRLRKAATGTADSLSAPARSAGIFIFFTTTYQAFIGSECRLAAAGRQAAGRPARGFAAVLANTFTISGAWGRAPRCRGISPMCCGI